MGRERRPRPQSWHDRRKALARPWTAPFHRIELGLEWVAWYLSRWALLEVLEYMGSLSVLVAVVFYFLDSGNRVKQRHYQAWQVINTAQGKGGSGGRIEALQELNADRVPLVGVDAGGAFLQGVRLHRANLLRCDLGAADLRDADLSGANMEFGALTWTNFRGANLSGTDLTDADLENADFMGANLSGADLGRANLKDADLRKTDLRNVRWKGIASMVNTNVNGIRNAPAGFLEWALAHGAIATPADEP